MFDKISFEMEKFLSETVEQGHLSCGENILLYGVPGSGKSWTIAHEYCNENTKVERLVFHPDYTYAEFVGQILPDVQDGEVTYKFTVGSFTSILRDAYQNPNEEYLLIIEEINRGNAPAIFGEIFQLLDRMIENSFDHVRSSLANAKILDTGVTWQHFCETVNDFEIFQQNVRDKLLHK